MALSYRCSQCGRVHKATEEWIGKVVNCEGCGKALRIPNPRAAAPATAGPSENAYGLSEKSAGKTAEAVTPAPRSSRAIPRAAQAGAEKSKKAVAGEKPSMLKTVLSGVVGLIVVLGMVGRYVIRPYRAYQQSQARNEATANVVPGGQPTAVAPRVAAAAIGPWKMPVLPEPGEGFELEPGVRLHEVQLPGGSGPGRKMPGHSGKLWLYLPDGDHAPKSLPCILIAGAGSNLITGMSLGDGDRAEHLPYVRAGFVVLAYELDGMLPEPKPTNDAAFVPYIRSFVDAEAGLVNMRVAVAYATTRVPSIDPGRLFAVGHSSAATLALLVAENEPRIAACVAFAPVVDIKDHIPTQAQQALGQLVPGADQIFTRFNPRAGEEKLNCPVFVFVALDDQNAQPDRALVDRLTSLGKSAVLATVPNGGHYEPMIRSGIPLAIHWLKGVHRQPDGSVVAPKSAGPAPKSAGPAPKARIPRVPRGGNAPPPPGVRRPRGVMPKQ